MGKVVLKKAFKLSLIPFGIGSVVTTICLTNIGKPLNKLEPLELDKIPEISEEIIEPVVITPPPQNKAPLPPPPPPAKKPEPKSSDPSPKDDVESIPKEIKQSSSSSSLFGDQTPPEEVLIKTMRTIVSLNPNTLRDSLGDLNSLVNSVEGGLRAIRELQIQNKQNKV